MKRKSKKPAAKKRQKPIRSPADSAIGRQNVIAEDLGRQLRVVAEAVQDVKESLGTKIDEHLVGIKDELSTLRIAVKGNSNDITEMKADISTLKTDVGTLKTDVGTLKTQVIAINGKLVEIDGKLDLKADTKRVDALEERVSTLEAG